MRRDVKALERGQRRFTRMIPGIKIHSCEGGLQRLGLFSLEKIRLRGDLIERFKILRDMDW